jgi:hypothetical protein
MAERKVDEAAVRAEMDEVAGLFGRIVSRFGPGVLAGPAAMRLAQALHERRRELESLLRSVSEGVLRANHNSFSYRPWIRQVPAMSPTGSGWVHISLDGAEQLRRQFWLDAEGFTRHGQRISSLFSGSGETPNTAVCDRITGWCHEQERDLRQRIEYARAAPLAGLSFGANGRPNVSQRGTVTIPDWKVFGPNERGQLAGMQARRFSNAFRAAQSDDPARAKWGRAELANVAGILRAHQGEPEYLTGFWRGVDPRQAAGLAGLLNSQDRAAGMDPTQVFTPESKEILGSYAKALAAGSVSRTAAPGGGVDAAAALPLTWRTGFVNAAKSDMWSASMLFKYGPNGSTWDPNLLSAMTGAVMEWRKTHGRMPSTWSTRVADSYRIEVRVPENSWYGHDGVGLLPAPSPGNLYIQRNSVAPSPDHNAKSQWVIADFDPARIILSRAAENPGAARTALQNPKVASDIMAVNWTVPAGLDKHPIDISGPAGKIFEVAARSNRDGSDESRQSAQAVVNILAATHKWSQAHPKEQMPAGMRAGLQKVAQAYVYDIAYSSGNSAGDSNALNPDENMPLKQRGSGVWTVNTNSILVTSLLKEAFANQKEIAQFRGYARANVTYMLGISLGEAKYRFHVENSVKFLRLVDDVGNGQNIAAASEKDKSAAEAKAYATAFLAIASEIPGVEHMPGVGQGLNAVQTGIKLGAPFMERAYKPPNETEKATEAASLLTYDNQQGLGVLLVEALVARGAIKPDPSEGWYKDGRVVPNAAYHAWLGGGEAANIKLSNGQSLLEYEAFLRNAYGNYPISGGRPIS